MRRRQNICGL